ncbi:hypothetical protein B0H10DRAFT_2428502, partial [Mycena sp. CBHHK59/15]
MATFPVSHDKRQPHISDVEAPAGNTTGGYVQLLTTLQADRISAPAPTRPSTTTERQSPASLSARDH